MKKSLIITLFSVLIFSPYILKSQEKEITNKIILLGKTDNRTMEHLDVLSNRFGGRILGSDAYENAANWCAAQFAKWGMEVVMQEVGELPVGFNRGPWFGRMLSEDGFTLHFATPSYTSGTKGVQRGHVVMEPKTQAEFDKMKGKLKGAWVLISGENEGWPIDYSEIQDVVRSQILEENLKNSRYNDSIGKVNKDNPTKKAIPFKEIKDVPALLFRQMREAGILGIIQSSKVPIRALYDRSNINYMNFESLPTCPDIKLDENQYKIIAQKVKERQYFLLEFDIRNYFKMGPVKYHNVIGIIRGTQFPSEYVMTGGHLDSFDVASGGVDDGSGVTPNMEAARLIMAAGGKPKRTILFCLWAGEEFGLLGSKYWVEQNKDNLINISNYFNRDGGPTVANSITVPEAMFKDFEAVCAPLNSINPDFPFKLNKRTGNPRPKPTLASGSDFAYFAMNGVPTISFGTADPKGYDFNYNEIWHTERDMFNMSIPEYQEHTAIVTAIVLYGLSNLDSLLSRKEAYKD